MPIGINDIISAWELAVKLYDWGSSKYTSAYVEYKEFMRDIEHVSAALRAVQKEVDIYQDRHETAGLDFSTLDLAVGGVHDTLKRCERLLRENPKFQWNEGFIVNIDWNFSLAEQVKALQTRVLLHCTKINLVIQPLHWHIQRNVREILVMSLSQEDRHFGQLSRELEAIRNYFAIPAPTNGPPPVVPPELVDRFIVTAASKQNTEKNFIQDHIDAVVYWYEASTRSFVPEPPTIMRPPTLQYLNLLKCLWMLQAVRQSPLFDRFCHDTLSKAYVHQLEERVNNQFQRFQGANCLQAPDVDDLLSQSPDDFEIWPDLGIVETAPAITEAQSLELQLFKIPLQKLVRNRGQKLTVFRAGEHNLRLAISITSPTVAGSDRTSHVLDCRTVVLVPIYAHPKNKSSYSVSWKTSADDPSTRELPFETLDHLLHFQEAITNFVVRSEQISLKTARGKGTGFKVIDGIYGTEVGASGSIQLWEYRKPRLIGKGERQQSGAVSGGTSGTESTKGWSQEILEKFNASSRVRSIESGGYLDPPIPGKLVLYTLFRGRLRIVAVTLDEDTFIDTSLCDCGNKKKAAACTRVCIKQDSDNIKARIYDGADDISKFNIALLRHPPRSDSDRNSVEQAFKFLTLDLGSAEEKAELSKTFHTLTALRRDEVAAHNLALRNLRSKHVYKKK